MILLTGGFLAALIVVSVVVLPPADPPPPWPDWQMVSTTGYVSQVHASGPGSPSFVFCPLTHTSPCRVLHVPSGAPLSMWHVAKHADEHALTVVLYRPEHLPNQEAQAWIAD